MERSLSRAELNRLHDVVYEIHKSPSSSISSASSRSSSSVSSLVVASPFGSGIGEITTGFFELSGVDVTSSAKYYHKTYKSEGCESAPLKRHFRIVPSRLVLTMYGSILVFPASLLVVRSHSRIAVTSCQCASISPTTSNSNTPVTSYSRMMSPYAVTTYGSANGVNPRGRTARTGKGWTSGGIGFVMDGSGG